HSKHRVVGYIHSSCPNDLSSRSWSSNDNGRSRQGMGVLHVHTVRIILPVREFRYYRKPEHLPVWACLYCGLLAWAVGATAPGARHGKQHLALIQAGDAVS